MAVICLQDGVAAAEAHCAAHVRPAALWHEDDCRINAALKFGTAGLLTSQYISCVLNDRNLHPWQCCECFQHSVQPLLSGYRASVCTPGWACKRLLHGGLGVLTMYKSVQVLRNKGNKRC